MPDISMCQHSKCEKHSNCYRYRAIPKQQYQSYMDFKNICHSNNQYKWFWSIEGREDIRKEELQETESK